MSGPFVYNPGVKLSAAPASPSPYVKQYYGHHNVSPFMPPTQLVPSPIIPNPGLPGYYPANLAVPGTPAKSVHFADDGCPALARPRSWHTSDFQQQMTGWVTPTGGVVPVLPPSPAAMPAFLSPQSIGHHRRHSFTQVPQWLHPASPWPQHHASMALAPPTPEPKVQIHPFLDGKNVRPDFYFDLSAPEFLPQRRYPNGTVTRIPDAELEEAATHPGIKQMTIIAEGTPQWPVVLKFSDAPSPIMGLGLNVPSWVEGSSEDAKPIALRDVLYSIWSVMQTQITHLDWGRLSPSEEHAVSRAYTRRCKTALQFGEEVAVEEQAMGVKKIDFLLDKHMFRGLKPAKGSGGFDNMVMVLSARQ